jgi:4-amino-4-deoxychorismate lyase
MLLLETIKVENRQLVHISYHNERFNRSRQALFGAAEMIHLEEIITIPKEIRLGIYKCRIIYDADIHNIEFSSYQTKSVASLQLVQADDVNYNYKYLDRNIFAHLLSKASEDDILIIKDGFITDTSYANIVFWDGIKWLTPSTPLLRGTKRQALLDAGEIIEAELKPADLKYFYDAKLINAMLDWENAPTIPIENIKFL